MKLPDYVPVAGQPSPPPSPPPELKWGWMRPDEELAYGPFDSRDEAVANAQAELIGDEIEAKAEIVIGHCRFADPGIHTPDCDDIAEQMERNAYDNDFGFCDDEIFETTCPSEGITHDHKVCTKQRDEELKAWARRWFHSTVWTLDEVERVELVST